MLQMCKLSFVPVLKVNLFGGFSNFELSSYGFIDNNSNTISSHLGKFVSFTFLALEFDSLLGELDFSDDLASN